MALRNIPLGFSKNFIWILNLPMFLNNCPIPITSIAVKMEYLSSLYIESGVEYVAEIAISQAHAAMISNNAIYGLFNHLRSVCLK